MEDPFNSQKRVSRLVQSLGSAGVLLPPQRSGVDKEAAYRALSVCILYSVAILFYQGL